MEGEIQPNCFTRNRMPSCGVRPAGSVIDSAEHSTKTSLVKPMLMGGDTGASCAVHNPVAVNPLA